MAPFEKEENRRINICSSNPDLECVLHFGGGVNSYYNCNSTTLLQDNVFGEVTTHRANSIPSTIGGRCAELGWGLVRRKIISNNTLPFKQFFSSPSLVLKLGESLVIELHFPAQELRKEQLETIIHNKTQVVTASVSEAVQFCHINNKNISGLLRRIAPRNDRGKYFIPSPRGRAREGVKPC